MSGPGWLPAEKPTAPAAGEVHVFLVAAPAPGTTLVSLRGLLSAEELARAERLRHPGKRLARAYARASLRSLLGRLLDAPPLSVTFAVGPHGKPRLPPEGGARLHFNLSDSADLALIAVALDRELGVDLERINPRTDVLAVARRFFAPGERQAIDALPAAEQRRGFFRCWTRKEAYLKLTGAGMSQPLGGFEVSVGEAPALVSAQSDPDAPRRVTMTELDLGPEFAACLAVEGSAPSLRTFRFEP